MMPIAALRHLFAIRRESVASAWTKTNAVEKTRSAAEIFSATTGNAQHRSPVAQRERDVITFRNAIQVCAVHESTVAKKGINI